MQNENLEDDYDSDLAHWLEDSGRRRAIRLTESPEELLKYLEELTGQTLSTRESLRAYFNKLKGQEAQRLLASQKRRRIREAVLVVLLGVALGQYYFWDVYLQIASMERIHFFVPVAPTAPMKLPRQA